ncbi:hypothetical protein RMN56_28690 [Micromonospora halotolerans]|uniref:Uncharacterized protein n=1 Tax=Micromonospora halotolerans TaxID=709879 RepID=A0ABY9ZXH0_9ACTN|nr:hypothetical protein [Micromonospora halotolerans]WNM39066.1 hypothetical protein RMN56_28690 [Micromonospora halotolerans]
MYVDAPATTPHRIGLFSAAVMLDPADQLAGHGYRWIRLRRGH